MADKSVVNSYLGNNWMDFYYDCEMLSTPSHKDLADVKYVVEHAEECRNDNVRLLALITTPEYRFNPAPLLKKIEENNNVIKQDEMVVDSLVRRYFSKVVDIAYKYSVNAIVISRMVKEGFNILYDYINKRDFADIDDYEEVLIWILEEALFEIKSEYDVWG